ncbi:hypothetical protein [Flavobacterium sp. H4147]|uniref:hypothetical protein n=1 Tax=Flavobacterium sp. H4147 TaxID=3034149 RepID=UPI0023EBE829|nr:hypothetical protein [Flavobacterium sp. H4147]
MKSSQTNFLKITNQFSIDDFEKVRGFILEKGQRKTYRNYDNHNPYYDFKKFEAYLGADIGQQNINNDPQLSNFNELTLKDDNQYYKILIVRKGDIQASKKGILNGMQENETYYVDAYQKTIKEIPDVLLGYFDLLQNIK